MKKRFAVVIWWLGAASLIVGAFSGFYFALVEDWATAAFTFFAPLLFTVSAWAICFVLEGTFRQPPDA